MDIFLQALLSYLISLAANERTIAIHKRREKNLRKTLEAEDALRKSLTSSHSIREEVALAAAELVKNRLSSDITPEEAPLWRLADDEAFQNELSNWLMAGGIEEGGKTKERLSAMMKTALEGAALPRERLDFLTAQYFEVVDREIFSNPILAHWRHQLSLDYLREQVAFLRTVAEEAAGIYSAAKQREALDRYCAMALKAWDIIDLSNLPEGDINIATQALLLRQLYVPLRIIAPTSKEITRTDKGLAEFEEQRDERRLSEAGRYPQELTKESSPYGTTQEQPIPVGEILSFAQRLVVLGDPGGGKTTLLRWMATAYLLGYRNDPARLRLPDVDTLPVRNWIPVLIRCRDLGEADLCRSFTDFITQHFKKTELLPEEAEVVKAVVLDSIAKGEALLLVDGLDEISNPEVRALFCQELERTAARYPDAAIIVTSRIVGYRDMPYRMGAAFGHGLIAELTKDDKELFAQRWVDVTEQHQPREERARRTEELIEALHSSDRIERLTGNPMLLTTLALVKRKVGKLPSRRTKLYTEAVSVLLNWNPRFYKSIEEEEAIPQLEFLAYEMCRRGVQRLAEDEVLDLLDRVRDEYPNVRPIRTHDSRTFLELLEARSSIIIKSGGVWFEKRVGETPVWEFRHLTFQEFLASRALIDGRYPGRDKSKRLAQQVAPLAGIVAESQRTNPFSGKELEVSESWREVLRLCVAGCKDDDVDETLLAILLPQTGEDLQTCRPRVVLATSSLADEPNVSEETAQQVVQILARSVEEADGQGLVASSLDAAAMELANSIWFPIEKDSLIREFRQIEPHRRSNVGGLCAMVEAATFPKEKNERVTSFTNLVTQLSSQDASAATSAALTVMQCAYDRRAILVPGLVQSLLRLLKCDAPLCHAAAWALGWLCHPRSGSELEEKALWQPIGEEVDALIEALLHADRAETETKRWLGLVIKQCRDMRPFVESLLLLLDHHDPQIKAIAIQVLSRSGDTRGLQALKELLDDEQPTTRALVIGELAKTRDIVDQKLLSRAFNARPPWLDPREEVRYDRVATAATQLKSRPEMIRGRYEALASKFGLRLAWGKG